MDIRFTVNRIFELCHIRGIKKGFLCTNLGVRPNYFTDCKNKNISIPDDRLKEIAVILSTTVAYLTGETDDPNFHLSSVGMTALPYIPAGSRPVFGRASAGLGVHAEQEYLDYEPVSPEYDTEEYFWLEVRGDSMSPVMMDKDLVLVHRDAPVESGTIMVVIVDDDDGFVKQVSVLEDTVTLHSFNPQYAPMVFGGSELGRVRFIGRVVEQKRKF